MSDRKSPLFAKGAKDGAPSSSYVGSHNEEHGPFETQGKQECLCHLRRFAIRIRDEKDGGEGLNAGGS